MKALRGEYRVRELCAALEVSASGYYRFLQGKPSCRSGEDALLGEVIQKLHEKSRGTYGRPRLTEALRREGRRHSPKRVRRLMKERGLRGVQRGRYRPQTTNSQHQERVAPNLQPGAGAGRASPTSSGWRT